MSTNINEHHRITTEFCFLWRRAEEQWRLSAPFGLRAAYSEIDGTLEARIRDSIVAVEQERLARLSSIDVSIEPIVSGCVVHVQVGGAIQTRTSSWQ